MKELASDFKAIYHNDRSVLLLMALSFFGSAFLVFTPLFNLNAAIPKITARYSDISLGYSDGDWWYLLSFSVLGLVFGIVHVFIAARLYTKRSADVSRFFLVISLAMIIIASAFLIKILGEG